MKTLPNLVFQLGKFWLAAMLFMAMIISTIVSLPFVVVGMLIDLYKSYVTSKNRRFQYHNW